MPDSNFEIIDKEYLNTPRTRKIPEPAPGERGMLGFLIKKNLVKDEHIGNYVLIGVAVFFCILSYLAFVIL